MEIWRNRLIVEDGTIEDENTQVSYAIKIEPDFEIGEELSEIDLQIWKRYEFVKTSIKFKIQKSIHKIQKR